MKAIVACLLLLSAGCFAAPVEDEQILPISDTDLANLNEGIKHLAGDDYSLDDFSKPVQLFFWKVHMMSEIERAYEGLRSKLGLMKEDSAPADLLQKFFQQVLLAIVELPLEAQTELEDAVPVLKGLKDSEGIKPILGEKLVDQICSAKPGNDDDFELVDDSQEPLDPEEE